MSLILPGLIASLLIYAYIKKADVYSAFISGALEALPMVGQVRGRKLMICVENVADKATRALLPEDLDVGTRIADTCEAMGLIVRPLGHLNVMSPPLTLTAEDVGMVGDMLERAIRQVADDLVREGVKLG